MRNIKRGDVFWVDLPIRSGSHVEGGFRPCVIVASKFVIDSRADTLIVCPLTTQLDWYQFHPKVFVRQKPGQVLCDQVITIDRNDIVDYIGHLPRAEMIAIDACIKMSLGLEH